MCSGMSPISSRKRVPCSALLEFADMTARSPGEGSFSCPNNSDSISSGGDGCTVRPRRVQRPLASLVQRACHQFLTRARLAQDADSGFARGSPVRVAP